MHACKNGNLEIVEKLLEFENLDVNAKDYNGRAVLQYAIRGNYSEIVEALLPKVVLTESDLVLFYNYGNLNFCKLLLQHVPVRNRT